MNGLESSISEKLNYLNNQSSTLDYVGAVELQSMLEPKYDSFRFHKGFIWCFQNGVNMPSGVDEVTLTVPFSHNHKDTMAETLTEPITRNFGGSTLVGNFTIGGKQVVSQGNFPISIFTSPIIANSSSKLDKITYPLYGENVFDWRYTKRSHNNLPPYTNIYIRYNDTIQQKKSAVEMSSSFESRNLGQELEKLETTKSSIIEPAYESKNVYELESYQKENVTDNDFILRLSLDEDGNPILLRQSLKHFLSIFVDVANDTLSREFGKDIKISMS